MENPHPPCIYTSSMTSPTKTPKTPAAVRDIDIPKEQAEVLWEYIAKMSAGRYLFATASGKPMSQRNVLRYLHNRHKGWAACPPALPDFRMTEVRKRRRAGNPTFVPFMQVPARV